MANETYSTTARYYAERGVAGEVHMRLGTKVGFTPASRSRITLPEQAKGDLDPWADIACKLP